MTQYANGTLFVDQGGIQAHRIIFGQAKFNNILTLSVFPLTLSDQKNASKQKHDLFRFILKFAKFGETSE